MRYLFFFLCSLTACTPAPQEIYFGEDACHFCLMTIVDDRHAGQLVTSKGKAYKFDAIECMVRSMRNTEETQYAFQLVSDYETGALIDAENATYLISPGIPSPMGAFLSAFESYDRAADVQKQKDGQLYDWTSLGQMLLQ